MLGPYFDRHRIWYSRSCSFIHGTQGNPIFHLAKRFNLPYKRGTRSLRVIRPDGSVMSPRVTAGILLKVFGSMFGWLTQMAQGGEEEGSVPSETANVWDTVFGEDSPIYQDDGDVDTADDSKDDIDLPTKEEKKELIRLSEMVLRGFQGWSGAPLDYMSLKWWGFQQDTEGEDAVLIDGYGPMLHRLVTEIERLGGKIVLGAKVESVTVDEEEGVTLKTSASEVSGNSYHARYALLTLPLGVLKHNPPSFNPPLPYRRRQAIHRMGMGLLDKVVVVYDRAWWTGEQALVGEGDGPTSHILLPDKGDESRLLGPSRGSYPSNGFPGAFPPRTSSYLEENPQCLMMYDMYPQNKIPALCIFMGGEFGDVMECCSEEETKDWATRVIKDWLGKAVHKNASDRQANIPEPVQVIRTSWRKDPNACGSYSYIPVGVEGQEAASPADQLELQRTLWDSVFWAGEHTEVNQFASVHGAWTSGVREAGKILTHLENAD